MKELFLEVITPAKAAFSGKVKSVSFPGLAGGFQVLYNHAPLMSSIETGLVKVTDENGSENVFCTSGGTVQVAENKILVLAESFESKDEIDVERAESSLKRAKERLAIKFKPEIDEVRAETALKRAVNRLKLAGKN
ncbi:MAG: ATP synthase F1 subunit epsilon [Rhodothermaceae bacterium]